MNAIEQQRRHRYLVLALVLALLLPALLWVCLWQQEHLMGVDVSADGSRFAALTRLGHTSRYKLTVWDGELNRITSFPIRKRHVNSFALSTHGDLIAVGTSDRGGIAEVQVLDVGSGERQRRALKPMLASIDKVFFSSDESSLLVADFDLLAIVPLDGGQIELRHGFGGSEGIEYVSRDRSKLGAFGSEQALGWLTVEVYDVSPKGLQQEDPSPLVKARFDKTGYVLISNSGSIVMSHRNRQRVWTDITHADGVTEIPGATVIEPIAFTPDERQLFLFKPDELEAIDLPTGNAKSIWRFDAQDVYRIVLNRDTVLETFGWDHEETSRLRLLRLKVGGSVSRGVQPINRNQYRWIATTVLLAAAVWMFLWVRNGLTSRWRWRPLVDVTILQTLLGVGLMVCVWSGQLTSGDLLVVAMSCWMASALALYAFFVSYQSNRTVRNLSLFALSLAILWRAVEWYELHEFGRDFVVVGFTLVALLFPSLALLRALGFQVVCTQGISHDALRQVRQPWSRTTIRDLMLLTASIAAVALATQMTHLRWRSVDSVAYAVGYGAALVVLFLLCAFLALGTRWVALRLTSVVLGILSVSMATQVAKDAIWVSDVPWYLISLGFASAALIASLTVFRLHGYRIGSRSV